MLQMRRWRLARAQLIERTPYATTTLIEIIVVLTSRAKQFLDRPDVVAGFEQMGGKRVVERVAGHRRWNARGPHRVLDRPQCVGPCRCTYPACKSDQRLTTRYSAAGRKRSGHRCQASSPHPASQT